MGKGGGSGVTGQLNGQQLHELSSFATAGHGVAAAPLGTPKPPADGKARRAATRIQRAFKRYRIDRSVAQASSADKTSWWFALKVFVIISCWYTLSTMLTVFNKWVYGAEHGKFPAPLLVTGSGMLLQFYIGKLFFFGWSLREGKSFREALASTNPNAYSEEEGGDRLPWGVWWRRYAPVSFMTGLDYGASNLSLVYITLSFYTMVKSSSPLFLLLFAFLLRLEQPSWKLTGIMGVIMSGVMLSVYGELKFDLFGFVLVLSAAFLAGCRWGYVQILLQKGAWFGKGKSVRNSVITLYNMAVPMASIVLFFSFVIERPWALIGTSAYFSSFEDLCLTLGFIVFSGFIAFNMVIAEFVLVAETSAVTFTVAGSLKELLTIFSGMVFFGDKLSAVNGAGLGVLIVGVVLYNFYKVQKLKREKEEEGRRQQAGMIGAAAQEAQDAEGLLNGNHARSSDAVFTLDDEEDDNSGL